MAKKQKFRMNWWAVGALVGIGMFWGGLFMAVVGQVGPQ